MLLALTALDLRTSVLCPVQAHQFSRRLSRKSCAKHPRDGQKRLAARLRVGGASAAPCPRVGSRLDRHTPAGDFLRLAKNRRRA